MVSFIIAIVICLFFILAGFPPVIRVLSGWAPAWLVDLVSYLSFLTHFMSIERGVLDFRDVFYYASVIFFMLFINGVGHPKPRNGLVTTIHPTEACT